MYIHSPVQSATRLTAYHIYGMRLVRSSTTTHRDLSKFINTDGVSHKVMISNSTPSVVLILITESKRAIPIEVATDRQSLDFYPSSKLRK